MICGITGMTGSVALFAWLVKRVTFPRLKPMMRIAIDYRTQYEAAEERIRELEAQVSEMQPKIGKLRSEIEIRDGRIAKAKAILTKAEIYEVIANALEALEGK